MNNALTRVVISAAAVAAATACSTHTHPPARTAAPNGTSSAAVSAHKNVDDADGVGAAHSAPPVTAAMLAAQTYVRLWARPQLDRDT